MSEKIKILYPNVQNDDEYYQVEARFTELSSQLVQIARNALPEEEWEKASNYLTAKCVYDKFHTYAREKNRKMYMTWDEIRYELQHYEDLEQAIQYLLDNGYIKEGYLETP